MAYDQQQLAITRQQQIAQALQDSGNISSARVNQVAAGGYAVPISKFELASKLLQSAGGAYAGYKADQAQSALLDQQKADKTKQLGGLLDILGGPSQMGQPQAAPGQAPVSDGTTTNFDTPTPGGDVTQQAPAPAPLPGGAMAASGASTAPPAEMNPRRAMLAAALNGSDPAESVKMLQGPALATLEPGTPMKIGPTDTIIDPKTGRVIHAGLGETPMTAYEKAELGNKTIDQKRQQDAFAEETRHHKAEEERNARLDSNKEFDPIADADLVKKAAAGEIELMKMTGGRNPHYAAAFNTAAMKENPKLGQDAYPQRRDAEKNFAPGGSNGKIVTSLNNAVGHMALLDQLADAKQKNDIPMFQHLLNTFSKETGHSEVPSYEAARDIVADEVSKSVIPGGGAQPDRQAKIDALKSEFNNTQIKDVTSKYRTLLGSQLADQRMAYVNGMSRSGYPGVREKAVDDFNKNFVTPAALAALPTDNGVTPPPVTTPSNGWGTAVKH